MSENPSENSEMADVTVASDLLRRAATPVRPGELIAHQIRRAARKVGITESRAKSIWYREARAIRAHEIDALRKTAGEQCGFQALADAVMAMTSDDIKTDKQRDALKALLAMMGDEG